MPTGSRAYYSVNPEVKVRFRNSAGDMTPIGYFTNLFLKSAIVRARKMQLYLTYYTSLHVRFKENF